MKFKCFSVILWVCAGLLILNLFSKVDEAKALHRVIQEKEQENQQLKGRVGELENFLRLNRTEWYYWEYELGAGTYVTSHTNGLGLKIKLGVPPAYYARGGGGYSTVFRNNRNVRFTLPVNGGHYESDRFNGSYLVAIGE